MSFDYTGTLAASRQLSKKNAELSVLRQSLARYRTDLHAAWSGADLDQVDRAIQKLIDKIRRAQLQIDSTCRDMNRGAAQLKAKEETERAAVQLGSAVGGTR